MGSGDIGTGLLGSAGEVWKAEGLAARPRVVRHSIINKQNVIIKYMWPKTTKVHSSFSGIIICCNLSLKRP